MAATAKDIEVRPVSRRDAAECIRRYHYSGKPYCKSTVHLGVFLGGRLYGAMQFGDPVNKRLSMGLVSGTGWHQFTELNRMAFGPELPRNSESRALSVALRILRNNASQLKWVQSFADGAQCGDGTIYRASGFVLTQIKKNSLFRVGGGVMSPTGLRTGRFRALVSRHGTAWAKRALGAELEPIPGFQLRYVYFLDPAWRARLTCAEIPFSRIAEVGAKMYLGKRAGSSDSAASGHQSEEGGASPTSALPAYEDG